MDYGVLLKPSPDWILIRAAIFCAVLCIVLGAGSIIGTVRRNAKSKLRSSFLPGTKTGGALHSTIAGTVAALAFIAIWPLLGVGLWNGRTQECYDQMKYATDGFYKIADAKLVYYMDPRKTEDGFYVVKQGSNGLEYIYVPGRLNYYILSLQGRPDSSLPPEAQIRRCIIVPLENVLEGSKIAAESPKKEVNPVKLPAFAIKYKNGWWQFTNELPRQ